MPYIFLGSGKRAWKKLCISKPVSSAFQSYKLLRSLNPALWRRVHRDIRRWRKGGIDGLLQTCNFNMLRKGSNGGLAFNSNTIDRNSVVRSFTKRIEVTGLEQAINPALPPPAYMPVDAAPQRRV
jgi:hypothetical protein